MGIGLLILILGIGHPAYTNQGIPDIVTRKLGTEVRPVYTIPHIDPTIPTDTGIISKLIIFCQEIVMVVLESPLYNNLFLYFNFTIFFQVPRLQTRAPTKIRSLQTSTSPKTKEQYKWATRRKLHEQRLCQQFLTALP